MKRPAWSVLIVPVLASLLLVPAAAATPAQVDAEVALPLRGIGVSSFGADQATLVAHTLSGDLDWGLTADRLTLVEVEYWEHVPEGGLDDGAAHSGVRTETHELTDARLALDARMAGFTALLWSDDAVDARTRIDTGRGTALPPAEDTAWLLDPDVRVFRLGAPFTVDSAPAEEGVDLTGAVLGRPVPFTHEVAAGRLHVQAADAHHRLSGPLEGYLESARITVRHAGGASLLELDERVEERAGSVYLPGEGWTGPGTHKERIVRYAQLATPEGRATVRTTDAPVALYAPGLDLDVQGHLAATRATGSVAVEGEPARALADEALVVSGDVQGMLSGGEDPRAGHLSAAGDVTYVRTGDEAAGFPVAQVATVTLGLAVLATVGMVLWKTKEVGLGLLLFSRVSRAKALDHDTRSEIYELIKTHPGMAPHEVVERLDVGWSTVTYHLDVLERTELVVAHKQGRYRRYFDRTTGRFANGRKQVVSVLQNETTARIAHAVRDHPGLVQRRLAEALGMAPSSIHWHVKRLVEAGLVEKERAARAVALRPGPAWEKLAADDAPVAPRPIIIPGA